MIDAIGFQHAEVMPIPLSGPTNRRAHERVTKVIAGDTGPLEVEGGAVTLQVGTMLRALQQRLVNRGLTVAERFDLGNVDREVVLLKNDRLKRLDDVRQALDTLNTLVLVLFPLTLVAAVAAVVLHPSTRSAMAWLGGVLALGSLVVVIAIQVARQGFLGGTTDTVPSGVRGALFDAVSDAAKMGFRFLLAVGVVGVAVAFLTGLPTPGTLLDRRRPWWLSSRRSR